MDRLPPSLYPSSFPRFLLPQEVKLSQPLSKETQREISGNPYRYRKPVQVSRLHSDSLPGEKNGTRTRLSQGVQKQLLLETVDLVRELGGPNPHLLKSLQGPSPMNNYFGSLWPTLPKLWGPKAMLQCGMSPDSSRISFLGCKKVV